MSLIPTIQRDDTHDDLCWQCGRDTNDCICGHNLPDDFDPLNEGEYDPDWDEYINDLGENDERSSTLPTG